MGSPVTLALTVMQLAKYRTKYSCLLANSLKLLPPTLYIL